MEYYPTVKRHKSVMYTTGNTLTMLNKRIVTEDYIPFNFIKLPTITYNSELKSRQLCRTISTDGKAPQKAGNDHHRVRIRRERGCDPRGKHRLLRSWQGCFTCGRQLHRYSLYYDRKRTDRFL